MIIRDFDTLPKPKQIFCRTCETVTNHNCRYDHYRKYEDDEANFWEVVGYRLWICAGCDTGLLEEYYTNSDWVKFIGEERIDGYKITSNYHPAQSKSHIKIKKFKKLPDKLAQIYRETLEAFNRNMFVLCTVGLGALLDGISTEKINREKIDEFCAEQPTKIYAGKLESICEESNPIKKETKIKSLKFFDRLGLMKGILPNNLIDNLNNSIRPMRNIAVHELEAPNQHDLRLAIEICEDLMNYLYELDYKTGLLKIRHERPGRGMLIEPSSVPNADRFKF